MRRLAGTLTRQCQTPSRLRTPSAATTRHRRRSEPYRQVSAWWREFLGEEIEAILLDVAENAKILNLAERPLNLAA
jgi:hypothetical protein